MYAITTYTTSIIILFSCSRPMCSCCVCFGKVGADNVWFFGCFRYYEVIVTSETIAPLQRPGHTPRARWMPDVYTSLLGTFDRLRDRP